MPDVVAAHDGLLTRAQALAAGMTDAALRHACRPGGCWQRLDRGVYATFTGALTARQQAYAAVLSGGSGAVLSGAYACRAYGLRYVPAIEPPLVLVPVTSRGRASALARLQRSTRTAAVRTLDGIPLVGVEQAVLDTAAQSRSLQNVRALVCDSVQQRLTTPQRLAAALADAPRRHTRLARLAVADVAAGCRSAPECELRDLIRRSRLLPEPRWNVPLPILPDVTPDAWFEQVRLVLEVDSAEHHAGGLAPEQTQRRHARIAAAGWTLLPISPRRIRREPQPLLLEIESAYRALLQP
jgi:very-short-patch-repair endonuclease